MKFTYLKPHLPVGMKKVLPASSSIRAHLSTVSPKKISLCLPDNTHCSYSWKLRSVGGINQNICGMKMIMVNVFVKNVHKQTLTHALKIK